MSDLPTNQTGGLVDWLTQQIAEDEQFADGYCWGDTWRYQLWDGVDRVLDSDGDVIAICPEFDMATQFIARFDPARVLAECAAKRALIHLHAGDGTRPHKAPSPWPDADVIAWGCQACGAMCSDSTLDGEECPIDWRQPSLTLRLLAAPYRSRLGWLQEWEVSK